MPRFTSRLRPLIRRGCAAGIALAALAPTFGRADVIINEVYPSGGNSGASYNTDFIELFNNSPLTSASVAGYVLQYFTAAGTSANRMVTLPAVTLRPLQSYLIAGASGANGVALPTPDLTTTIDANSSTAKFKLLDSSLTLIDLVGYGTSATEFEGATRAPSPANAASSISRIGGIDTNINGSDFTSGAPSPTNLPEPAGLCAGVLLGAGVLRRRRAGAMG